MSPGESAPPVVSPFLTAASSGAFDADARDAMDLVRVDTSMLAPLRSASLMKLFSGVPSLGADLVAIDDWESTLLSGFLSTGDGAAANAPTNTKSGAADGIAEAARSPASSGGSRSAAANRNGHHQQGVKAKAKKRARTIFQVRAEAAYRERKRATKASLQESIAALEAELERQSLVHEALSLRAAVLEKAAKLRDVMVAAAANADDVKSTDESAAAPSDEDAACYWRTMVQQLRPLLPQCDVGGAAGAEARRRATELVQDGRTRVRALRGRLDSAAAFLRLVSLNFETAATDDDAREAVDWAAVAAAGRLTPAQRQEAAVAYALFEERLAALHDERRQLQGALAALCTPPAYGQRHDCVSASAHAAARLEQNVRHEGWERLMLEGYYQMLDLCPLQLAHMAVASYPFAPTAHCLFAALHAADAATPAATPAAIAAAATATASAAVAPQRHDSPPLPLAAASCDMFARCNSHAAAPASRLVSSSR